MSIPTVLHIGRSWEGSRLEDECPCEQAPCGLAISDLTQSVPFGCPQHGFQEAKTMRQMHPADQCPGVRKDPRK